MENYLGHFLEKLQKIWKKYKKLPAKGAREARPFVAGAFFCTFSIFFAIFTKNGPGSFAHAPAGARENLVRGWTRNAGIRMTRNGVSVKPVRGVWYQPTLGLCVDTALVGHLTCAQGANFGQTDKFWGDREIASGRPFRVCRARFGAPGTFSGPFFWTNGQP